MPNERVIRHGLAWGGEDAVIRQTLSIMRGLVYKSDGYRIVKNTAAYLIRDIDPRDYENQVKAIFEYVLRNMRYVRDVNGVEEIRAPWLHLASVAGQGWSWGDCDDMATLLSALLRAIGFDTAFSAIASGRRGEIYDHVRAIVRLGGQWVSLEATAKNRPMGWSLPKVREILLQV